MAVKNANDARTHWAEVLDLARDEPVHIVRRGREVAVVVSPSFYARAAAAIEDLDDIAASSKALQSDEPRVSHEELLRELGLGTA